MNRNLDLSVRQSEELSVAQSEGMNRADVKHYFKILRTILIENGLLTLRSRSSFKY
jgi:hypothetical protein